MKNLFSFWREEIFKILSRDRFLSRDLAISLQNLEQFLKPRISWTDFKIMKINLWPEELFFIFMISGYESFRK